MARKTKQTKKEVNPFQVKKGPPSKKGKRRRKKTKKKKKEQDRGPAGWAVAYGPWVPVSQGSEGEGGKRRESAGSGGGEREKVSQPSIEEAVNETVVQLATVLNLKNSI